MYMGRNVLLGSNVLQFKACILETHMSGINSNTGLFCISQIIGIGILQEVLNNQTFSILSVDFSYPLQ